MLKAQPEKSNRTISRQTKVSDKTVAKRRVKLEARSEIPHVTTVKDTKGRTQPAQKKTKRRVVEARDAKAAAASPAPDAKPTPSNPISAAWTTASGDERREFVDMHLGTLIAMIKDEDAGADIPDFLRRAVPSAH